MTKIIGLDVSENMVAEFNRKTLESRISAEKMFALKGNLLEETIPEHLMGPDFFEFDIVAVSAAIHHFADAELAMKRLGSRLKKGGIFFILELLADHHGEEETQNFDPEAAHTVHKHGFRPDEMRELYVHAGLAENFDFQIVEKPFVFTLNGREFKKTIFMARGERS